jgi:hypothetical protein
VTAVEAQARRAVLERFAEGAAEGDAPTMDECERIVSAHGLYPATTYAETYAREALLIYLGAGWGVGPRATWRDRLRAWWACR